MNNNNFLKKSLAFLLCISLVGGITYYMMRSPIVTITTDKETYTISDYDEARDKKEIMSIFETERYWLLSSDDYDVEFMLEYKAPDKNPLYLGALHIKVMHENGNFVGFSCYYKETPTIGTILFLAIKEKYRNKGYAKKLMKFVMQDLVSLGSKTLTLVTRVDNLRGQAVYNKLGFKEVYRDIPNGQIHYEMPAVIQ